MATRTVSTLKSYAKEKFQSIIVREAGSNEAILSGDMRTLPRVGESIKILDKTAKDYFRAYTVQSVVHKFGKTTMLQEIEIFVVRVN
jgi:hypothetical protein